jgi:predicted permease
MDILIQDLRFAVRQLRKSPTFTLVALITLAIGIGATTAIFALADAVLLRPLQFANQSRLVQIFEDATKVGFPKNTPAAGNFIAWKERNRSFVDMAATRNTSFNVSAGTPEKVDGARINANLLSILGVQPALGRGFASEEDRSGGPKVALISAALWQQRFGSDPNILSRDITLNYAPYRIVGVMPHGFTFPEKAQIWVPIQLSSEELQNRNSHNLHVYGLLREGVSLKQANTDLENIAHQLANETPDSNLNLGAYAHPLREEFVGDLKLMLMLLLAGVACVLLISCGNVAGLMMARAAVRNREIAIRAALGASRGRLIQQAIIESVLLALSGSVLGLLLTAAVLPFLSRLVPIAMAAWAKPVIDWRLVVFTTTVSVASALLFGLVGFAPVKINLLAALQQGGRGIQQSRTTLRRVLVGAQIGLALPLLVASCLMVQTVWKLSHQDLGFTADHVLTARTPLAFGNNSPYEKPEARNRFYREVVEGLQRIPGVLSAGYTSFLPLTNLGGTNSFTIEGQPPRRPGEYNDANVRFVSPNYLQTLEMRLLSGRLLQESDNENAPGAVVITKNTAQKYFHIENPVGRRINFGEETPDKQTIWYTVVGVIEDIHQAGLDKAPRPEMYFPYSQMKDWPDFFYPRDLAVRASGDPSTYSDAVRKVVWSVDPLQPVANIQPMTTWMEDELSPRNIQLQLFAAFGVVSLLLSAIGLYGLLAFTVTQRKQETGVRMALGAQTSDILRLYLVDGVRIIAAGVGFGVAASLITQRLMQSALYGVSDGGLIAIVAGSTVLIIIGLVAVYMPAREASRTEPMEALRTE